MINERGASTAKIWMADNGSPIISILRQLPVKFLPSWSLTTQRSTINIGKPVDRLWASTHGNRCLTELRCCYLQSVPRTSLLTVNIWCCWLNCHRDIIITIQRCHLYCAAQLAGFTISMSIKYRRVISSTTMGSGGAHSFYSPLILR